MIQKHQIPKLFAAIATVLTLCQTSVFAAGSAAQPAIYTRAEWSARAPQCAISVESSLDRAVIHHTAIASDYNTTSWSTTSANIRAIQNSHMDGNGWCDIGYHFLVDKLGNRAEGRQGSLTQLTRGAHDSVNTASFGFNCMGSYHYANDPEPPSVMREALYDLIAWRMPDPYTALGSGTYGGNTVGFLAGHRDVIATACPGDKLYTYIGTNYSGGEARLAINSRITGNGGGSQDIIVDNVAPAYVEAGSWGTGASPGYGEGTYRFATAGNASTNATWTVSVPTAGTYDVSVYYLASTNRSTGAAYEIATSTGTANATINQTLNSNSWVSLGVHSFNAGNTTVRLNAATSTGGSGVVVIADAVKLTPAAPPPPPPPAAPSSLAGTAPNNTSISLTWVDNSSNETGFTLERKRGTGAYAVVTTTGANVTSFLNTGLSKNTSYTFRVKSINGSGSSAYSNEVTVKTPR
ncbi:MAG: N-acetylmuramoyl-L-alanine amidase [Candidatus Sumerlaeia bacterium]|nr:N-acetylmuramoyl-L-alanine amidase [Candidatus Sumerlaeia bacterium]